MKKLISAATALTMAATMVSSIVPTVVSAADAKKGFSIEAYKEADSKYSTMGNDIKVSKDDIAAGDVVIPCAVYLDETTNDMLSLSVSFSVTSSSPDVKNVKITEIPLSKAYFDTKKSYTTPDGKTFETDIPVAFSGELSGRGVWSNGGSYQIATDPSQSVAGADYYYLGCSWTNGGRGYTYSSAKSTDHPFLVFNVTLPKGTSEGTYTFDYCKYNTDTSGQYDNPTPMVEVAGKRYTIANSNLDLKPMTITVGDAAPADTTTTTKPVVTTTTSKAPEAVTTTTAGNPGSSNAQIAFDMGDYKTVAGDDKLFVDVKVDTKGNKMTSADVIFNIQSPLEITEIDASSPATGSTVVTNLAILGANLICTDENSDPMIPDADSAIFQLTVNVPSSTPDGTYKIGMDKCLVYTNGGKQYTTEVINGNIVVGEGGTPATTTKPEVTTTTSKAPEAVTTTTVGNPGSSNAQIAFDMGDYKTVAGNDKLFVDVKVNTKGNKMTSADVIFNIQSPLEITEIDASSPATGSTVVTNIDILGANLICTDENSDPMIPDADSAIFQLTVNVPAGTPDGTYKIGMDKCLVYTNGGKQYTTEVINGNIVVGDGGTPVVTTTQPVVSTTTTIQTPPATTTETTPISGSLKPVWGDTNCDGTVNVADVVVLNKWLNNNASIAITDQGKVNADCCNPQDASGAAVDPAKVDLTAADSDAIIRSVVHLITLPTQG